MIFVFRQLTEIETQLKEEQNKSAKFKNEIDSLEQQLSMEKITNETERRRTVSLQVVQFIYFVTFTNSSVPGGNHLYRYNAYINLGCRNLSFK